MTEQADYVKSKTAWKHGKIKIINVLSPSPNGEGLGGVN